MLHRLAPCLLLLAVGCAFPRHEAHGVQDFTVPISDLVGVRCGTHNGSIVLQGSAAAQEVRVRVRLSVRGHSEAEAQENLLRLSVRRDTREGWLQLRGEAPDDFSWNLAPTFDFTVEMPAGLSGNLSTHNGDLEVAGMSGALTSESHNGHLVARGPLGTVHLTSHNGNIRLEADGDGPLVGNIESHNGAIELTFGAGRSVAVEAGTHNGNLQVSGAGWRVPRHDGDVLLAERGQPPVGKLTVTTHNGDVTVR